MCAASFVGGTCSDQVFLNCANKGISGRCNEIGSTETKEKRSLFKMLTFVLWK